MGKYIEILEQALDGIELTDADKRLIEWILNWDRWTVNQFVEIIKKCRKTEDVGLVSDEIMNRKKLTGWIPVEERLPPEPKVGRVDFDGIEDYIVMIEGAVKPTFLAYVGDGEWYRDGAFYRVISWMPLPETYKPGN